MHVTKKPWVVAAIGLAAIALLAAPVMNSPLATIAGLAFDSFRPQRVGWDAKTAWTKCDAALSGTVAWPADPALACAAMQMCANEAALGPEQRASLASAARRLPGCDAP